MSTAVNMAERGMQWGRVVEHRVFIEHGTERHAVG